MGIISVTLISCVPSGVSLINNSDPFALPAGHFENCILPNEYTKLFPKLEDKKVWMEYHPLSAGRECEGVYYYRVVSASMRQPLLRDSNGLRYSRYSIFIIRDERIIPLSLKSKTFRCRYVEKNTRFLTRIAEGKDMNELSEIICNGYLDIY